MYCIYFVGLDRVGGDGVDHFGNVMCLAGGAF